MGRLDIPPTQEGLVFYAAVCRPSLSGTEKAHAGRSCKAAACSKTLLACSAIIRNSGFVLQVWVAWTTVVGPHRSRYVALETGEEIAKKKTRKGGGGFRRHIVEIEFLWRTRVLR